MISANKELKNDTLEQCAPSSKVKHTYHIVKSLTFNGCHQLSLLNDSKSVKMSTANIISIFLLKTLRLWQEILKLNK